MVSEKQNNFLPGGAWGGGANGGGGGGGDCKQHEQVKHTYLSSESDASLWILTQKLPRQKMFSILQDHQWLARQSFPRMQ